MLSKTETILLKIAVDHINEFNSIEQMKGFRQKKQVKRKKTKKSLKNLKKDGAMKKANAIHVYETLTGAIKMAVISYLRLDLKTSQIQNLVYGLSKVETERFMAEIRVMLCKDVMNHYKHGDLFIRPIEVHKWLYKSSYLTRSTKLAKELTEQNGLAFTDDILALKDHYIKLGRKENTDSKTIEKMWSETEDLTSTQDSFDFLCSILDFEAGIRMALRDIETQELVDKKILKRCKYVATQVKTLTKIMHNYIMNTQEDIEKHTKDEIELNELREYRKSFGKYQDILQVTCDAEGIKFTKENEYIFYGYYEELLGMNKKRLVEEKEWLGVA